MKKVWSSITKNFKVLLRNKVAAVTVLFAPLLIVLLVGFAYTTGGDTSLLIGLHGDSSSRYIDAVNQTSSFRLIESSSQSSCEQNVRRGIFDACLLVDSNTTTNISILVDKSRQDIAQEVETSLRREIGSESEQHRRQIVTDRYKDIESVTADLSSTISSLQKMKESAKNAYSSTSDVANVNTVSKEDGASVESLRDAVTALENTGSSYESQLEDIANAADAYLDETSNKSGSSEYDTLVNETNTSDSLLSDEDLTSQIDNVSSDLDSVEQALSSSQDNVETANQRIKELRDSAESLRQSLKGLRGDIDSRISELKTVKKGLQDLSSQDVSEVADPVETRIEAVGSTGDFSFGKSTPYLVAIETFFFALLLGGAIAFNQNVGKPSFRENLTPLHSLTRVVTVLITGFIISVMQTGITAGAALGHLGLWSVVDPWAVVTVLLLGSLLSLLLGVILGQVFRTMQGLLLGALTTGSVFIAFSNFIAPLERLHPVAQTFGVYNPFNIMAESLRRAFFFNESVSSLSTEISVLGTFIVLGVVFAIMGQYRWERDTTAQQNGSVVRNRVRLRKCEDAQAFTAFVKDLSWYEYVSIRPYLVEHVDRFFEDVSVPWFRQAVFVEELQSSSSMSSMSSNESKSSSSSSSSSSEEEDDSSTTSSSSSDED